ncbi:hypothetical protein L1049_004745 [Liquidambar formosana]|uniref:Uncharacterized protein n=1 Tax=Liquidambar formosana TaxID=63359 RepID=A0AAP0RTH0_LIQFO
MPLFRLNLPSSFPIKTLTSSFAATGTPIFKDSNPKNSCKIRTLMSNFNWDDAPIALGEPTSNLAIAVAAVVFKFLRVVGFIFWVYFLKLFCFLLLLPALPWPLLRLCSIHAVPTASQVKLVDQK